MAQSFFEINTKGTCLFCLSPSCAPLDRNNLDLTTSTALKMLFRYLHVDIRKLVNNVTLDSSTNLAVSLCDACFFLIDEFLELFQDFERIRLQLEGCTWKLHEFIRNGNKNGDRVREYQKRVTTSGGEEDELHAEFVEKLRMETSEKCSKKRGPSIPKISLGRNALDILENGSKLRPNTMDIGSNAARINIESAPPLKMEVEDVYFEDEVAPPISPTSSRSMTPPSNNNQDACKVLPIRKSPLIKHRRKRRNYNIRNKFEAHAKHKTHKCVHCSAYFSQSSTLTSHQLLVHPVQILSIRGGRESLPPGVSDDDVSGAVDNILARAPLPRGKTVPEQGPKLICPLCRVSVSGNITKLRLHILRCHQDQVFKQIRKQLTPGGSEGENSSEDEEETVEAEIYQKTTTPPSATSSPLTKRNIPCDICGKRFSSMINLNRHKHKSHRKWSFKCKLCSRLFIYDKTLQRHIQEFHLNKPFDNSSSTSWSCDYCDKVYPFKNCLQHHLDSKHAMQLYASRIPPSISEHVFESTVDAIVEKILVPVKAGNRVFQKLPCVFCGKALPSASNSYLRVHILRIHLEKVIESAEKAIVIKKRAVPSDNWTSSVVPCESEYSSVPPIQVEDTADWRSGFELEGEREEHPLVDEDPLGI